MADDLHTRIAGAIYAALREQHDGDSIDAPMVTPEIGGDGFTGYATIDGEVNLLAVADAVIAELDTSTQKPAGLARQTFPSTATSRIGFPMSETNRIQVSRFVNDFESVKSQ